MKTFDEKLKDGLISALKATLKYGASALLGAITAWYATGCSTSIIPATQVNFDASGVHFTTNSIGF